MDPPPPSPPPDTNDIAATEADIEIPEPDYDDDDTEDEVAADPVSGVCDDEPADGAAEERGDADSDHAEYDDIEADYSDDDDDVDEPRLGFDGVRAKLEAFSVNQQLRGSVPAADQDVDIPEPDYSDSDDGQPADAVDEDIQLQLITAKKLVNPCLESKEHKAMRRELAFNQKLGINVLDNKTELHKEIEKRKQRQQRRDDEQQRRLDRRSSFELRLEQQANKLDSTDRPPVSSERSPASADDARPTSEFLRVHAKINQSKSAS